MSRPTRLNPSPSQANYLLLRCLAAQLRKEVSHRLPLGGEASVLDVGCGSRPYEAIFSGRASEYVGVDSRPGPGVDLVADADRIPVGDGSFDCVLSSQVLEHVPHPLASLEEMFRVLRPGGLLLLSTHGMARYHPNPDDYWRWTHAGLARLLEEAGDWSEITIHANGGVGSTLAYLIGVEVGAAANSAGVGRLWSGPMTALNAGGWALDRALLRRRGRVPGLSPNYLACAVRAPARA